MLRYRHITTFCALAVILVFFGTFTSCKKNGDSVELPPYTTTSVTVDGASGSLTYNRVSTTPVIAFNFSAAIQQASVNNAFSFRDAVNNAVPFQVWLENNNQTVVIKPVSPLKPFSEYVIVASTNLLAENGGKLKFATGVTITTGLDVTDKFPRITDEALMDLVQKQTFKYFWDFGHPVSGMARERNTSGDLVTTGGTGFGIMAVLVAIRRNFITREEGLNRISKITAFLKNTAQKHHGAFSHWLNGSTGVIVPFSAKDDGADLVETSFLIQGLLTARQFFDGVNTAESALRNDINTIWQGVEWSWFRKNNEEVLYWHWSPNHQWEMNHQIRGWNEALLTYVLAASAPLHSIPRSVYDNGWAANGAIKNGNSYYGIRLPLGPQLGGPLFFAHYSFLGIDPHNLSDTYASYWEQNTAHALINYNYCKANPKGYYMYSDSCWGLTASDNHENYSAHSPTNDLGVISPTAALSSFPYTPVESMKALHFFYYKLGDKIWGDYGFTDAFNLNIPWFANSYLAIDQGPIIVMIENHRSGLLWNLFMSCPEIKTGMRNLGYQSPQL